ncbi:hypothetical protein ACTFIR_005382 [Dictyostelium discoideum]
MDILANIKALFIMLLTTTGQPLTYKVRISQCNDLIVNVPYDQCFHIYSDCAISSIRIFQSANSIKDRINLYTNINCEEEDNFIEEIQFEESGLKFSDPLYFYVMFLMLVSIIFVVVFI